MRRLSSLFVATICLLTIFSCGQNKTTSQETTSSKPAAQARPDSNVLRLALLPTSDCLPFYYADKSGLFDSLGVEVVLLNFQAQADCDTALLGSSVDLSISDLETALLQLSKGRETAVIMGTQTTWSVVTSGALRIRKPDQLKKRMIAVSRNSCADYVSAEALEKSGLAYGDAFRPQINSLSLRTAMLDNNQVDAAALPEPWTSAARAAGHRVVFASDAQPGCIALRKDVLRNKAKADGLRRLINGYNAAVTVLNKKGKPEVRTILSERYKLSPAAVDSFRLPTYTEARAPKQEEVDKALGFLKSRGLVRQKFNGEGLLNNDFVK